MLERVLLDGLTAVDATVHADDGLLWLFVNVVDGPAHRGDLCVYWSPSLKGPWRPHPANPVVSDPRSARPAGRLFRHGTALIRPSQDCSRRYGEAVVILNQVEVLSKTDYRERPVGRIDPDWMPGLVGTHTYTFAVYSFLSNVASQLRAAGLGVVANIGGSTITRGLWQKWNGPLNGAMEESFTNGGAGRDSIENGEWLPKLRHAAWSEANGKLALDHAVTRKRSGARYGLATMLLVAHGENLFYASERYRTEMWWPEYRTAAALGAPRGSFRVLPNGVFRRNFANGVVLVNPHTTGAGRVRLGHVYRGSGLGRVRSVRMPRTTGGAASSSAHEPASSMSSR